ncbi:MULTISPECIES: hypothetical protein [unclassified Thiocapsa]|uniref:hypothetical protein n=1 Tax=unclassified Thiocapsa TaxID=2641286 RepID=UPI0035B35744
MPVYHDRLFDKYRTDVVSLAVLADATASFRPDAYRRERWGCALDFRYPTHKLLDLLARWDALEADPKPFAVVVMAHLKAQESKEVAIRKRWKLHLVRLLYPRGHAHEDTLELFRVIDWLLQLPPGLEHEFKCELIAFEEQANMPYITSIERLGRQEGQAHMLISLLSLKLGPLSDVERPRIQTADAETLLEWSKRLLNAQALDDIFEA